MERRTRLLRRIAEEVQAVVDETPQASFGQDGGMGASGLPASHIDRLTEQRVLDVVEASDLEFNICSEEIGTVENGAPETLIVDPVDGTLNATRAIPFYCVALAITTSPLGASDALSGVQCALVRNLLDGTTYEATRGGGATREGAPIQARAFDPGNVVASPMLTQGHHGLTDQILRATTHVRIMGAAALELCLVAEGALDLYLNAAAGLRIVDVAAGKLILEEAGGHVRTLEGRPLEMGLDVRERRDLVAVGDLAMLERLGVPA